MNQIRKIGVLMASVWFTAAILTSCGGTPPAADTTATSDPFAASNPTETIVVVPEPSSTADSSTGLPADLDTYYKTMVFIEGTGQLMQHFNLAEMSNDAGGMMSLIAMPGVMDNQVIAAQQNPVPGGFEEAWEKALQAEQGLFAALEGLLMTALNQDAFDQAVAANTALASEAVAAAESVLAAQFGVSQEEISAANRAALTEMGEAYQQFASFIAVGQAQGDDGSE